MNHLDSVIAELESQRDAIDRALASLRGLGSGTSYRVPSTKHKPQRLSAQGRRNIIEAAKKRWAAIRAARDGAVTKKAAHRKKGEKRVLSAEARKKMAEAAKKRWAAQKKKAV